MLYSFFFPPHSAYVSVQYALIRCSSPNCRGSMVRSYQRLKHPLVPLFCLSAEISCIQLLPRTILEVDRLSKSISFFRSEPGAVRSAKHLRFASAVPASHVVCQVPDLF